MTEDDKDDPFRPRRVRIVSDGTAHHTRVMVDGNPLPNVASVTIHPIAPNGVVRASVELVMVELDIAAEAALLPKAPGGQS